MNRTAAPKRSLDDLFAPRASLIAGSPIDRTIELLDAPAVISLAMGSPAPETLPRAALAGAALAALGDPSGAALNYAPTPGDPFLRAALLGYLDGRGVCPAHEQLLITAGGMQGLDLAFKLFVGPGDLVVTESPTYPNGTAAIASYEGRVLEVPVDCDGMVVEDVPALVEAVGREPKLFYVIPNFQNPSGTTMSLDRRLRLLDLADEYGALVVEDDPYAWLGFDGFELPSLWSLAGEHGRVVAVHTFSKTLAPGLRVGWTLASEAVVSRMVAAKQSVDTCANALGQRVIATLLSSGFMDAHLANLRQTYEQRRDVLLGALDDHFGDVRACEWTRPRGGMFLWLSLPPATDAGALVGGALRQGVAVIAGSAFSPSGLYQNSLRLSFSHARPAELREAVRRLRVAFDGCGLHND